MREEHARELHALTLARADLLRRLAKHSDDRLRVRPKPGAWSVLEVAEHLMLSEQATLDWIMRARADRPLRRRWYHAAPHRLIAATLGSSVRIPWTGRRITPVGVAGVRELERAWDRVAHAWDTYATSIAHAPRDAFVFRHPIGVPMTVAETLIFLGQHFDHHLRQVARIERSAAFRQWRDDPDAAARSRAAASGES